MMKRTSSWEAVGWGKHNFWVRVPFSPCPVGRVYLIPLRYIRVFHSIESRSLPSPVCYRNGRANAQLFRMDGRSCVCVCVVRRENEAEGGGFFCACHDHLNCLLSSKLKRIPPLPLRRQHLCVWGQNSESNYLGVCRRHPPCSLLRAEIGRLRWSYGWSASRSIWVLNSAYLHLSSTSRSSKETIVFHDAIPSALCAARWIDGWRSLLLLVPVCVTFWWCKRSPFAGVFEQQRSFATDGNPSSFQRLAILLGFLPFNSGVIINL